MPAIRCTACGSISFTENQLSYTCDYCGTQYPKADFSPQPKEVGYPPVIDFGATIKGKNVSRLLEKADLYWDMGNIDKARNLYQQVIENDPNNEKAKERLRKR